MQESSDYFTRRRHLPAAHATGPGRPTRTQAATGMAVAAATAPATRTTNPTATPLPRPRTTIAHRASRVRVHQRRRVGTVPSPGDEPACRGRPSAPRPACEECRHIERPAPERCAGGHAEAGALAPPLRRSPPRGAGPRPADVSRRPPRLTACKSRPWAAVWEKGTRWRPIRSTCRGPTCSSTTTARPDTSRSRRRSGRRSWRAGDPITPAAQRRTFACSSPPVPPGSRVADDAPIRAGSACGPSPAPGTTRCGPS